MRLWMTAVAMALTALPALPADAETEPRAEWRVEDIVWQRTNPDGTRFALLEGRRDRAGTTFTYAFFIPTGVWDGAHSHSATARVFVAKGALSLGYGTAIDRSKATTFPMGSTLIVPAAANHFDGAEIDTVIIGVATGPWSTTYVDTKTPPSAGTRK